MKSMTGMGRAHGTVLGAGIRLEMKSVNHRYCEVSTKLPGRFQPLDILIQQQIKKSISRGKVDLYVIEEKNSQVASVEIDAYKACFTYYKNIQNALGLAGDITLQDLTQGVSAWIQREVDVEKMWADFRPLLDAVMADLMTMRAKEGANLKNEMLRLFTTIETLAERIAAEKGAVEAEVEKRLREKIQARSEELGVIDPMRLQMEIVYYLDRIDITEELQRLKSHMDQVRIFLADSNPSGRKIDFLLQEFNREFNTIASKSQNSSVSHLVVEAKAELEKIREQVQNIE